MADTFSIHDCEPSQDGTPLLTILNHVIQTSTALYDYHPRSLAHVTTWMQQKHAANLPLRGAFDTEGQLIGFATYGPFRPQPAYKYTVELSIYVAEHAQGRGVASALMQDLIQQAEMARYHVIIGCIDATNLASIALHKKFGFDHSGTIKQAGFKFGRWLDTTFYQKILQTSANPLGDQ